MSCHLECELHMATFAEMRFLPTLVSCVCMCVWLYLTSFRHRVLRPGQQILCNETQIMTMSL